MFAPLAQICVYVLVYGGALQEPRRQRSFVFLPNFEDYQASHGDIGYLATIIAHRYCPTGDPNELPSADIKIHFGCRVLIHFHWVESDTGGLAECVCVPLEPRFADPMNDIAPLPSSALLGLEPSSVTMALTSFHSEVRGEGVLATLAGVAALCAPDDF